MEKSNPLPSRIPDQPPACSHLSSCKEECQHCKVHHEDVHLLRKESQSGNTVLNSKSSHSETPSFKYSISRLPRWAQAKVTDYNNVCRNVSGASSEVSVHWLFLFLWETKLYSNSLPSYSQFQICRNFFMPMKRYLEFGNLYMSRVIYVLISMFKNIYIIIIVEDISYLWFEICLLVGFQFWKCARETISF